MVVKSGKPGEQYNFLSRQMNIFSVSPQQDHSIIITASQFSKNDLDELKRIGVKLNGTLSVFVKKGVKVVQHNAQSVPKLFGLLGGYKWEIKSVNAAPFIIVQPSS